MKEDKEEEQYEDEDGQKMNFILDKLWVNNDIKGHIYLKNILKHDLNCLLIEDSFGSEKYELPFKWKFLYFSNQERGLILDADNNIRLTFWIQRVLNTKISQYFTTLYEQPYEKFKYILVNTY